MPSMAPRGGIHNHRAPFGSAISITSLLLLALFNVHPSDVPEPGSVAHFAHTYSRGPHHHHGSSPLQIASLLGDASGTTLLPRRLGLLGLATPSPPAWGPFCDGTDGSLEHGYGSPVTPVASSR